MRQRNEIRTRIVERNRGKISQKLFGMPGYRHIDIVEGAFADHEGLAAPPSSAGQPYSDTARDACSMSQFLRPRRRAWRGAEQVVAEPCRGRLLDRAMLGDASFLTQARKRIVFAEDGMTGPPSPLHPSRGGDAGDILVIRKPSS